MLTLHPKVIWIFLILCHCPVFSRDYPDERHRDGHGAGSKGTSMETTTLDSLQRQEPPGVHHGRGWTSGETLGAVQSQKQRDSSSSAVSLSSSAPVSWGFNLHSSVSRFSDLLLHRDRRSSLTRFNPGHTLPQVQTAPAQSAFGVRFHKCAQVKLDSDPPQLTVFLLVHNIGPTHGSNLSQVAIRDSISGIAPFRSEGREVERGYQTFAIDSLFAGSQVVVNYSAHIRSPKSGVLELPAFLTFSNASQNDVNMFGPLTANLTLRVNSTNHNLPNHAVHFLGFVGGFSITVLLLMLGFLALNLKHPGTSLRFWQQRRNRGRPDPEYGNCNEINESVKDEASLEDKMVDVMVLEDPQNMLQALENIEMSSLLHATNHLEAARTQIYKDLMVALLSRGEGSVAQRRLLDVLHGQLLGMEGRLKEELGVRMATLAAHCNLETREEMEAEHRRQAAEKDEGERLCQQADQQTALQCSVLLENLHKLNQGWLQRYLLVRHEEASARVQRQVIELRRVELHKIFCEELEEATRMGELDKSTATHFLQGYFTCQDHLENVLDEVVAHHRYLLSERHAQRKFLVHSLQSLHRLISDTFSNASSSVDSFFTHVRRGSCVPSDQLDVLQDNAKKELLLVRQRLDEALSMEKRALRCGLIKKRRELTSDMLRIHRQREKDLSSMALSLEGCPEVLQCWQNLLTAHSSEICELITSLDEEAAADIRKVTTCLLQGTVAELKAIQLSVLQSLQALVPVVERPLLQAEHTASWPSQERLQQEGQAALHTLRTTRDELQGAMERELREQRQLRDECRAFFRSLCSSQLTLSEDDLLQMKLEFQKSLSVMDWSLVLPPAVHRAKLHSALEEWRKSQERRMTKVKLDSELLLFQRRLQDKLQLFKKHRELEPALRNQVMEQVQQDRRELLLSQANALASQMSSVQLAKAQRRSRLQEICGALVSVQKVLMEQIRHRKSPQRESLAESIHRHCKGLAAAEECLQRDLEVTQTEVAPAQTTSCGSEEKVLELQPDSGMVAVLQEALHKSWQLTSLLAQRSKDITARNQVMEDLKEQMELSRFQENCNQELEFTSGLVKMAQLCPDVLKEALRLLLPSLPESELLSLTDALCPKQASASPAEPQDSGRGVTAKLRTEVSQKAVTERLPAEQAERIHEKWRSFLVKLLPPPQDVPLLLVEQKLQPGPTPALVSPCSDEYMSLSLSSAGAPPTEQLFVFRDHPQAPAAESMPRKRRRNFLNFKKSSVAPTNLLL